MLAKEQKVQREEEREVEQVDNVVYCFCLLFFQSHNLSFKSVCKNSVTWEQSSGRCTKLTLTLINSCKIDRINSNQVEVGTDFVVAKFGSCN